MIRSLAELRRIASGEGRPSAAARGYDGRWRKARAAYLARHPLCQICEQAGRTEPATEVHHAAPHRGPRDRRFWDRAGWVALCKSCHSRITAQQAHGT